jgi:hypothetical protein
MSEKKRWIIVAVYAAAMAWVEAAVVFYLRVMIDRVVPYHQNPLPNSVGLGQTEIVREIATLLMLLAVGMLAGKSRRSRLAYSITAFGIWDIFYYLFLIPISGWPRSLFDWDILFLVPLPWWGPILAPVSIAGLMVVGGSLVIYFERSQKAIWPGRLAWYLNLLGISVALYVFMADALRTALINIEMVRSVLPTWFNWPLFVLALTLMAAPIFDMLLQYWESVSVEKFVRQVQR